MTIARKTTKGHVKFSKYDPHFEYKFRSKEDLEISIPLENNKDRDIGPEVE